MCGPAWIRTQRIPLLHFHFLFKRFRNMGADPVSRRAWSISIFKIKSGILFGHPLSLLLWPWSMGLPDRNGINYKSHHAPLSPVMSPPVQCDVHRAMHMGTQLSSDVVCNALQQFLVEQGLDCLHSDWGWWEQGLYTIVWAVCSLKTHSRSLLLSPWVWYRIHHPPWTVVEWPAFSVTKEQLFLLGVGAQAGLRQAQVPRCGCPFISFS